MLDRDQTPPEDVLEYRIKARFYFQPHDASAHENIWRWGFATDAGSGEYDIPQVTRRYARPPMMHRCDTGHHVTCRRQCNSSVTPASECIHEISANLKVSA